MIVAVECERAEAMSRPAQALFAAETVSRIHEIAARHGVSNIRIFGSFARGEARPDSDVDLLVNLAEGRSLFDLIHFEQEVEDLLGRKVEACEDVHPFIRARVLAKPCLCDRAAQSKTQPASPMARSHRHAQPSHPWLSNRESRADLGGRRSDPGAGILLDEVLAGLGQIPRSEPQE